MLGNYLIGLSHMHKAKNVTGYILILAMLAMMLIGYICVKVYNLTVIIWHCSSAKLPDIERDAPKAARPSI